MSIEPLYLNIQRAEVLPDVSVKAAFLPPEGTNSVVQWMFQSSGEFRLRLGPHRKNIPLLSFYSFTTLLSNFLTSFSLDPFLDYLNMNPHLRICSGEPNLRQEQMNKIIFAFLYHNKGLWSCFRCQRLNCPIPPTHPPTQTLTFPERPRARIDSSAQAVSYSPCTTTFLG